MPSRFELIAGVAAEFNSSARLAADGRLELEVRVRMPSGDDDTFHIVAYEREGELVVGEDRQRSQRLPGFCPERHINDNATLCLFWTGGDDAVDVTDEASALAWFSALVGNLQRQWVAERRRRWAGPARRHGEAARHEARAETAAAAFGGAMLGDLRSGLLVLAPANFDALKTDTPVRLIRDGQRIFSKRVGHEDVANLRQRCPCQTSAHPTTLRSCSNHAQAAATLVDALTAAELAERQFIADARRRHSCCGTMENCPLASRPIQRPAA